MNDRASDPLLTPEEKERIRQRARGRGIAFEAFLPEGMADWLRAKIAAGIFESPREAAFVAFQQLIELDRQPEIRRQLLTAAVQRSIDDPRPSMPAGDVVAKLKEMATPDKTG